MTNAARIADLERQLEKARNDKHLVQNMPWGEELRREDGRLQALIRSINAELHVLRPYKACDNGSHWIVSHKGDFVRDADGKWRRFASEAEADAWIAEQPTTEIRAA